MAKKIISDMVRKGTTGGGLKISSAVERPSIFPNKIKISTISTHTREEPSSVFSNNPSPHLSISRVSSNIEPKHTSKNLIWILAVVSFLFLLFSFSMIFTSATVIVVSKTENLVVNNQFDAEKNGKGAQLSFEAMSLSDSSAQTLSASKIIDVEKPAVGIVVIYNYFGSAPQNLLIDTRLVGANGKIYKTDKAVVIPGAKIVAGETVPGSIEVGIHADDPGEEYNSAPQDFTIFGFKDTPKYLKFNGRSKGPITGGFKGQQNVIDPAEQSNVENTLKLDLKTKLMTKAKAELPDGFAMYENATFFNFSSIDTQTGSSTSSLEVRLNGTMVAFIWNKAKLTERILIDVGRLETRTDGIYVIDNIDSLSVSILNENNFDPTIVKDVNVLISGTAHIVWPIEDEAVAKSLAGQRRADFQTILSNYDNIDKAEVSIKPFWKTSFPGNKSKIKIIKTVEDK